MPMVAVTALFLREACHAALTKVFLQKAEVRNKKVQFYVSEVGPLFTLLKFFWYLYFTLAFLFLVIVYFYDLHLHTLLHFLHFEKLYLLLCLQVFRIYKIQFKVIHIVF